MPNVRIIHDKEIPRERHLQCNVDPPPLSFYYFPCTETATHEIKMVRHIPWWARLFYSKEKTYHLCDHHYSMALSRLAEWDVVYERDAHAN